MKAQCTSIVLAYFLPLIDCNLARVQGVVHGKNATVTCFVQGYKSKARDFATHATEIERGCSASETTLRVDDINIF